MIDNNEPIGIRELAELLSKNCFGDWWDKVLPVAPEPESWACESCIWHPLTEDHCRLLNRLLGEIRDCGGPAQTSFYPWCSGDLMIEWHSEELQGNHINLDIESPSGKSDSALVSVKGKAVYFVDVYWKEGVSDGQVDKAGGE